MLSASSTLNSIQWCHSPYSFTTYQHSTTLTRTNTPMRLFSYLRPCKWNFLSILTIKHAFEPMQAICLTRWVPSVRKKYDGPTDFWECDSVYVSMWFEATKQTSERVTTSEQQLECISETLSFFCPSNHNWQHLFFWTTLTYELSNAFSLLEFMTFSLSVKPLGFYTGRKRGKIEILADCGWRTTHLKVETIRSCQSKSIKHQHNCSPL